jgi:hypothetical protein
MKTYGGVQVKLQVFTMVALYFQGNEPRVPIGQEVGWTPQPGLDAAVERIPAEERFKTMSVRMDVIMQILMNSGIEMLPCFRRTFCLNFETCTTDAQIGSYII